MQLQGDLRRFQDARSLALRLISRKDDIGTSDGNFYERDEYDELYEWYADDYDDEWDSPWESWYEDGWLVMDYENYAADYEEDWSYYDGMTDEAPAAEQAAQTDDEQTHQGEDHSPSYSSDPTAESFPVHKGKGKGKGKPTAARYVDLGGIMLPRALLVQMVAARTTRAILMVARASPTAVATVLVATAIRAKVAERKARAEKASGRQRARAMAIEAEEDASGLVLEATLAIPERRPFTTTLTRQGPFPRRLASPRSTSSSTMMMRRESCH